MSENTKAPSSNTPSKPIRIPLGIPVIIPVPYPVPVDMPVNQNKGRIPDDAKGQRPGSIITG